MNDSIAYFDNAATTYKKPIEMYDFMMDFYRNNSFNIGRGNYSVAENGALLVHETRNLLLKLLCADDNKVVVFCSSATEALNTVIRGIDITNGTTIYTTPFEHNAVTRTLHKIAQSVDVSIIELKVDKITMTYDIEGIKRQFSNKKPDIVITTHVSNVCGIIAPIDIICEIAKRYSATTIIDGAQGSCLIETPLSRFIDYYVFAGHKTLYGPFGIAGIVCLKNSQIKPLIYGGTGLDSANPNMPVDLPDRLEAGSMNILSIAGLHASLKWIERIGVSTIYEKEQSDTLRLVELLNNYDFIRIIGNSTNCISIVSCQFNGYSVDNIGQILNRFGIQVRTGLHCAPSAHRYLGTFPEGTVRFSISYFTTDGEFGKLKQALDAISEVI